MHSLLYPGSGVDIEQLVLDLQRLHARPIPNPVAAMPRTCSVRTLAPLAAGKYSRSWRLPWGGKRTNTESLGPRTTLQLRLNAPARLIKHLDNWLN